MQDSLFADAHASEGRSRLRTPATALLKWPGGKAAELERLESARPQFSGRFIDPFVGGGAAALSAARQHNVIAGDTSTDLVNLYLLVQSPEETARQQLERMATIWESWSGRTDHVPRLFAQYRRRDLSGGDLRGALVHRAGVAFPYPSAEDHYEKILLSTVPKKLQRIAAVEAREHRLSDEHLEANLEGAFRAAWYLAIRERYNELRSTNVLSLERTVLFYFLREICYASMFRFSRNGRFNVPYGGVSYNGKRLRSKVADITSASTQVLLAGCRFHCGDFAGLIEQCEPTEDDFLFLDPPYDSDFSNYDNHLFGVVDHQRLAALMHRLNVPTQLVIQDSPLIRDIYLKPGWSAPHLG